MSESDEAPGGLRWIEELVNTLQVEDGVDALDTPAALGAWLTEHGLLPEGAKATAGDLRRTVRVREGLRALLLVNNGEEGVPAEIDDLAALANDLPLVLDVQADPPQIVPRARGTVDAALATLLATVATSVADGSWQRFKACRDPECQWAYYDHSRNRSRAWCSMATCGNRAKARAFRDRAR